MEEFQLFFLQSHIFLSKGYFFLVPIALFLTHHILCLIFPDYLDYNKDENNDQETQASLDADYNVDEFNLNDSFNVHPSLLCNCTFIILSTAPLV